MSQTKIKKHKLSHFMINFIEIISYFIDENKGFS
jgi:hypothetical protein